MNDQPVFNVNNEEETASMQQSAKTGEVSRDHHYYNNNDRPTRPPLHERQSSYAKRHASVDTPREVPLLKDWTNANGDPSSANGEYPFPNVFQEEKQPPSHRPELQPSGSSSGADSTTSLPSLDPISTHISQLQPQTHFSHKPDETESPLLFCDLDPDDILTPPQSQNPIPTDISTKRVTDPDMLTYTHPSSPYLPPRPPSPPLPTLELSPMPSRSRINANMKKMNGDEQMSVETSKKSPNFYEPQPTNISGPMPLQARRVPSPPTSTSAHQTLPQKRLPVPRKPLPPMSQPKSILKNAVPPSLPLTASKGWSSASPGLISVLQSPTNPEMKELLRLRNANRGRPVKEEELDMGPPSPPRILDTPENEGAPWGESGGGMPDVPYTPKHSLDTFRMSSASDPLPRERERDQLPLPETELKRNSTNTTPSRRASRGKGAVYEKFLAKEGAPPPPESGLGREIVVETKEKSYDIVVKLEGVGVEGITLTTRRPRTLLLSADYYHSTKGGHFERRIAFGSDADLGGVRAEFDGVWLRVIVPRKARGGKRESGVKAAMAAAALEPPVSA